ncbi:MAG: prolyl oligopeptidase family serine peptidase [Bacteroidetes bacterium]|nr:prolyl oligopeptidase family serine peptidase [Bacteroidota bacterium]
MKKYIFGILYCFGIQISFAQTTVHTLQHNAIERSYRLHLPPNYSNTQTYPLVINMHGYGSNAWQQEFYSNMNVVADTANFVVVYPDGTYDTTFASTYWNIGILPNGADDLGFISALIDTLAENYTIDQNRVYACGMSNGGFMSYYLSLYASDKIAAMASVTGTMLTTWLNIPTATVAPKPVLEIHGTNDPTVPYSDNAPLSGFGDTEDVLAFWAAVNGCNATPTTTMLPNTNTTDNATADFIDYAPCSENTAVEHYRINGGAHTWPGAPINLSTTCYDFDASETIWLFFKRFSLEKIVDTTTAVTNFSSVQNITFPTLFSEKLPIQNNSTVSQKIVLVNIQGKVLSQKTILPHSTTEIDSVHFPKGIYLLQVAGENKVFKLQKIAF